MKSKITMAIKIGALLALLGATDTFAQTFVKSYRLECTQFSRLKWECLVEGSDANPTGKWVAAPETVATITKITNRTAYSTCYPVDYDVRNGELIQRTMNFTVFTSYLLGPTVPVTRGVGLKCSSGEPTSSDQILYAFVNFPRRSSSCTSQIHSYKVVQCARDTGMQCKLVNQNGTWECVPIWLGPWNFGGEPFLIADGKFDPFGPPSDPPIFAECFVGCTQQMRRNIIRSQIERAVELSCDKPNINDCAGQPFGHFTRFGAVIKFDTGTSFKYELIRFSLTHTVSADPTVSFYDWTAGSFSHNTIYTYVYEQPGGGGGSGGGPCYPSPLNNFCGEGPGH